MGMGSAFGGKTDTAKHIIGELVPFQGVIKYFKDGNVEYLQTGAYKAYESKYKTYVNRAPVACYNDMTSTSTFNTAITTIDANFYNVGVYWDGTQYTVINTNYNGAGSFSRTSTNLTTWSTPTETGPSSNQGYSHCLFGTNVLYSGFNASTTSLYYKPAGTNVWTATNVPSANSGYSALAASASLAVYDTGGMATNTVYTAAIGAPQTWTSRTMTGTNLPGGAVQNIHWSPALSAFVHSWSGFICTSTDGFTLTTQVSDSSITSVPYQRTNHYAASNGVTGSGGITLMLVGTGIVYRGTTSGWTKVNLLNQPTLYDSGNSILPAISSIFYDTVNSRFIARPHFSTSVVTTALSFQYIYSYDGLTWYQGYTFRNLATLSVACANNKIIVVYGQSQATGVSDITSSFGKPFPDWVGGPYNSAGSYYYTRIA